MIFSIRQLIALLLLLGALHVEAVARGIAFRSFSWTSLDGLPTNLTKTVLQDREGYVWIGSDAGLVRYDGREFTTFTRELPSEFVKDLVLCPDDTILVVTDGGLGRIRRTEGSVEYIPIAAAGQERSDAALHYPKSVFADQAGVLWVSEGDAVVRVADGRLRRYAFSSQDQSESMLRAFMFAEATDGRLVLLSQRGGLFFWNPDHDSFESVPLENADLVTKTYAILARPGNRIWVGTMDGIFETTLGEPGSWARWSQRLPTPLVSALAEGPAGGVFIGTWRDGVQYLANGTHLPEPIATFPFKTINDLFLRPGEKTVWVSSDQGVGFFQPQFLMPHRIDGASPFTSLVMSGAGTVLATDGNMIFRVNAAPGGEVVTEMIHDRSQAAPGGFASDDRSLWVGKDGVVEVISPEGRESIDLPVASHIDFLTLEQGGALWICQTGLVGVGRMEPNRRVQYFGPENGLPSHVDVVRQGPDRQVYLGAEGIGSYLFRFDPVSGALTNLSAPPADDEARLPSIRVNDLAPAADGSVWLASNSGLLRWTEGRLERPEGTEELRQVMIKAVALDPGGRVWAGTDRGVYALAGNQLVHFSTGEGLSNLAINWRSILFDGAGALWIGTADGITWRPDPGADLRPTERPLLTRVLLEGEPLTDFRDLPGEFAPDSFVRLEWVSLSFPGHTIRYQWRLTGSEAWSAPQQENHLLLPHLPAGNYCIQWRAQQEGHFWSEPSEYAFTILPAWYERPAARLTLGLVMLSLGAMAIGYRRTVRSRREAEEELRINKERYALVALGANDGMWDWNLNTDEVFFSPRWEAILGLPERERRATPREWFDRVHPEDLPLLTNEIDLHRRGRTPTLQVEVRMKHADGTWRWMLIRGVAVRDGEGRAYRMAGSKTDISDRKRGEEQLLHAALHDSLTGLPNRTLFLDRLERALTRARRNDDYLFAVFFLDLNRFKQVNDTLGHMAGDDMLRLVARRLEKCMRGGDTVSRLGGDEFAVLLDDIATPEDAFAIARRILESISEPGMIGGHQVFPSSSIGIALSTGGYETPAEFLGAADEAMYRAKKLGSGRYEVHSPATPISDDSDEELRPEPEMLRTDEESLKAAAGD